VSLLKGIVGGLLRSVVAYEQQDTFNVPREGPAILAANHPSLLDPVLVSLDLDRGVHLLAWDAFLRVPLLAPLLRGLGIFPVDLRQGGGGPYQEARTLLEKGELVLFCPEGKASPTSWMDPSLRSGLARVALETGAPVVPTTIGTRRRAPDRPGEWERVAVRFQEPIDPVPLRGEGEGALLDALRAKEAPLLLPEVKAARRRGLLYSAPGPFPRLHEFVPAFCLVLVLFWKTRSRLAMTPAYLYLLYLLLDHYVVPQSRPLKWLRNASAVLFLMGIAPSILALFSLPQPPLLPALGGVLVLALLTLIPERGRVAFPLLRSLEVAIVLSGLLYARFPAPLGPHVMLPVFVAAYCWERGTFLWPLTVLGLLGYTVSTFLLLGPGGVLLPHLLGALSAWLLTRLMPEGREAEKREETPVEELGLRDRRP
jgi:1-acyl-sn-glycerol-3-phosphate acyltransferase